MPKDVDNLIESMFGFEPPKEKKKAKPKKLPARTLPKAPEGTPEDAARAVLAALEADEGRRKKVDNWKSVAAEVLGLKRLVSKRWQGVLDKGVELGLFKVDDETLSYPILVPIEDEPEPEPEPEEDAKPKVIPAGYMSTYTPPEKSDPPEYQDCGHMNWWTDEENAEAREEGHCCMGEKKKWPRNYQMLKGEHVRPVPKSRRRTWEKHDTQGWPGLCCHQETGLYIGGITNDCTHKNPKGPWCEVHEDIRLRRGKRRNSDE